MARKTYVHGGPKPAARALLRGMTIYTRPTIIPLAILAALTACTLNAHVDVGVAGDGEESSESTTGDEHLPVTTDLDTSAGPDDTTSTGVSLDDTGTSGTSGESSGTTGEPCDGHPSTPEECGPCHMVGFEQCACQGSPAPLDFCEPCERNEQGTCFCGPTRAPDDWCGSPYPACTQISQYRQCDDTCEVPCAGNMACLGPDGAKACSVPCTDDTQCPPTLFANPWGSPICDVAQGVCGVPCDAAIGCPNPGVYQCYDASCWPVI
jgi:hypothetical protein